MANTPPPKSANPFTPPLDPLAGFLSYLVPGLGQIVQGRVAKGVLFLVCIYALFFYGLWIGHQSVTIKDGANDVTYELKCNVYIPDTSTEVRESGAPQLAVDLYTRPQFVGQFWVGVAAWPAVAQYLHFDAKGKQQLIGEIGELRSRVEGEEDADKKEGLQDKLDLKEQELKSKQAHAFLGDYMREPSMETVNAVHNGSDKRLELAWVYTVIAGVLNILVIYDAVAGAAFATRAGQETSKDTVAKAA